LRLPWRAIQREPSPWPKMLEPLRLSSALARHGLATFLVSIGTNVKVVQELLRHGDPLTTLKLYSQALSKDKVAAQGTILEAMGVRPRLVN
jgi:integrase